MIKIIDYKAGNAPSVYHAVTKLGYAADYAHTPQDLEGASHIILPGVGSARATMDSLGEMGITGTLTNAVHKRKVFFLGICVGLQILFEHSAEGDTQCLGWLKGRVVKFSEKNVRTPQMGWNRVDFVKNAPVTARPEYFYFVNSYHAVPDDSADLWGKAVYGGQFTAAVQKDNIYGTQFHAEKSSEAGLALLGGFLKLRSAGG